MADSLSTGLEPLGNMLRPTRWERQLWLVAFSLAVGSAIAFLAAMIVIYIPPAAETDKERLWMVMSFIGTTLVGAFLTTLSFLMVQPQGNPK